MYAHLLIDTRAVQAHSSRAFTQSSSWPARKRDSAPRIALEAWRVTSMVSLVAAGVGVALLPAQVCNSAHPGVVYKALDNDTEHLELKIAVAWHPDRMSAGLQSMLSVLDVKLPWRAPQAAGRLSMRAPPPGGRSSKPAVQPARAVPLRSGSSRSAPVRASTAPSARPVWLALTSTSPSGGAAATIVPPPAPPSGPRSTI
ncbi:hypothetical protein ISG25_33440, partial [Burkholderia pseudomallei]|nr:hypothetical protein [Burkholderia pseudomallei]